MFVRPKTEPVPDNQAKKTTDVVTELDKHEKNEITTHTNFYHENEELLTNNWTSQIIWDDENI